MQRRHFTFASLALASPAAWALAPPAPGPTPLTVSMQGRTETGEFIVRLSARNETAATLSLLHEHGSVPGTTVQATIQGQSLTLVRPLRDPREMMMRAGPRPRYAQLTPGQTRELGEFAFALPGGLTSGLVSVEVYAYITTQAQTGFARQTLRVATPLASTY